MDKPIKIGAIGCSTIFNKAHGDAILRIPDVFKVTAVCDIDIAKAQLFKQKFHAEEVYTDYREMLEKAPIDAVVITTPTAAHCGPTIDSLDAGFHTFCEKPMAMTIDECKKMIAAAKRNNRTLTLGFQSRFAPAWLKIRELVKSGAIGDLMSCTMTQYWDNGSGLYKDWRTNPDVSGGGIIADSAVHWIDIMRIIMGEITSVSAAMIPAPDSPYKNVDDDALVTFAFENGTIGLLRNSWRHRRGLNSSESFEIFGTKGSVVADLRTPWENGGIQKVTLWTRENGTTWEFSCPSTRFVNQMLNFAAFVTGEATEDNSFDGLQAMLVQQEIYRAAKERRWIDIKSMRDEI